MAFGFLTFGMILLAGFSAKMLDGFLVKKKIKDILYLLINLFFIAIGTVAAISVSPEVVVSLLIALVLMGKIDKEALRMAYAFVLLITLALIMNISLLNPFSIAILAACAIVDEMEIRIIRDYRPSMWLGSILIGLIIGNWSPLIVIAVFDIGYVVASKSKRSFLKLLK